MEVTQSWRLKRWQAKAAITYCSLICHAKSCGMNRSMCVCIYETLHSSFSSNVATWVVVCLSQTTPGSPPSSWQRCNPIYGFQRQINQHKHPDKSPATTTNHQPERESNSDLEEISFTYLKRRCNVYLYMVVSFTVWTDDQQIRCGPEMRLLVFKIGHIHCKVSGVATTFK